MKKGLILITILLLLLTGCQPRLVIPEAQAVIDTVPPQLQDTVGSLSAHPGVFIFRPDIFETGEDTYIYIGHHEGAKKLVDVSAMNYTDDGVLQIEFMETSAPLGRTYSMIKLIGYKGSVIVNDNSGHFEYVDLDQVSCRSQALYSESADASVTLKVAGQIMAFDLSEDLLSDPGRVSSLKSDDRLMITYTLSHLTAPPLLTELIPITDAGSQTAVYIGQIDNHSIEVQLDGTYLPYQLSENARRFLSNSEPETGSEITFEYYTPLESNPVITEFIIE